jgi:hypothetical protein
MLRAWTVLVRRYVSDKWTGTRYREQWALALQPGSRDQPAPWRKVIPPVDRDWADPFPVRVGNDYYIFHEELHLSRGRGSIVLTVVDDKGCTTGGPIPILEQDCHLSYPLVFQWDGDYFMMPETASRRRVELYRCVSFPSRWTLERVLLPGLTAYDPTPVFSFGRWWLFATVPAHGAGTTDELSLFHAESPLGPWTAHRNNPINSDVRSARPAGRVFEQHGQMFRPAQDCSKRYGYAVSINRILRLDPEAYEEVEVNKITFNVAGNMTVIDWLVKRRRARR